MTSWVLPAGGLVAVTFRRSGRAASGHCARIGRASSRRRAVDDPTTASYLDASWFRIAHMDWRGCHEEAAREARIASPRIAPRPHSLQLLARRASRVPARTPGPRSSRRDRSGRCSGDATTAGERDWSRADRPRKGVTSVTTRPAPTSGSAVTVRRDDAEVHGAGPRAVAQGQHRRAPTRRHVGAHGNDAVAVRIVAGGEVHAVSRPGGRGDRRASSWST